MKKNEKPQIEHFKTYIEKKEIQKLRALISKYHIVDIVEDVVFELEIEETLKLLRMISMDDAAHIFSHLESEDAEILVEKLKTNEIKELFDEIVSDDIIELIEE
jgi:magnesium transporter